jgi:hypothetical protein
LAVQWGGEKAIEKYDGVAPPVALVILAARLLEIASRAVEPQLLLSNGMPSPILVVSSVLYWRIFSRYICM